MDNEVYETENIKPSLSLAIFLQNLNQLCLLNIFRNLVEHARIIIA